MKDDKFEKLLDAIHQVDKRLAVVEEKVAALPEIKKSLDRLAVVEEQVSALPEIKKSLDRLAVVEEQVSALPEIKKSLDGLKVKVGGYAAVVAVLVTLATAFFGKLLA